MTLSSDTAISSLGSKAEHFFRSYRAAGLKAVEDAAREHNDIIEVTAVQSARYVSGSWSSRFGVSDARRAMYLLAAFIAGTVLVLVNAWAIWLAWSRFGFVTIAGGVATISTTAVLGLLSFLLVVLLIGGGREVARSVGLAVSLWTRGWTPVSMEWFGADAGATWALGTKNLYIWQKAFHGWDNPALRVVRYQDIHMMLDPEDSRNFLALSLDFELPQPRTEWLRFPEAANGMSGEQLATNILGRARSAGKEVTLHKLEAVEKTVWKGEDYELTSSPP